MTQPTPLTKADRRAAMLLAHRQATWWSAGNGLTTGTLISYTAMELGASGLALSLVLAAPALVGILRLAAPLLIRRAGGIKPMAVVSLRSAYIVLAATTVLTACPWVPRNLRLHCFVGLIALHQLLESLGFVAIWAWLGAVVPRRIRGRYFAVRQRWQLAVLIPTLLAGGGLANMWRSNADALLDWLNPVFPLAEDVVVLGYALIVAIGTVCLFWSVRPLARMPDVPFVEDRAVRAADLAAPLADRRFFRLLLFGCWFSFFNGLTQSPQNVFPYRVLKFGVLPLALMRASMQLGQFSLSGWFGRCSDRYGNRPVLVLCQLTVAAGMLFYFQASEAEPWWIAGAWVLWSFYAGTNICLNSLMLKLAPAGRAAAYLAAYFALTSLAYATSTVLGGWLFDLFRAHPGFVVGGRLLDRYQYFFYAGWITRTMGVLFLLAIHEPGAWTWRRILQDLRTKNLAARAATE